MEFLAETYIAFRFGLDTSKKEQGKIIREIEEMSNYFELKLSERFIYTGIIFQYLEELPDEKNVAPLFGDDRFVILMKFQQERSTYFGMYTLIRGHIEKRVRDLIIAITIAKNGAVDCAGAQVYFDKKLLLEMPMLIHDIDISIKEAKSLKWPVVRKIQIKQVWQWYASFFEETDGLSTTKIGRALNAYSHFFATRGGLDEQAILFWALLGIEAIYVEGKDNIQQQVNEHTELFLGKRKEFKKSFKDLYEYRSRFVHGDLNINNQFVLKDGTDEFTDGLFRFYDKAGFAVAILVATFQKLARTDKREIKFTKSTKTIIS